jgi:phospholipid/cholesterol/gamma-HCH transport system permease protein
MLSRAARALIPIKTRAGQGTLESVSVAKALPWRIGLSNPLLSGVVVDDRLELMAAGSWTAAHAAELEALIAGAGSSRATSLTVDMRGVAKLDTFGAWILERLFRKWAAMGSPVRFVGLPDHYRGLLDEVRQIGRQPLPAAVEERVWTEGLEWLGRMVVKAWDEFGLLVAMLGELTVALARALRRPRSFRLTSIVHQLDRVCWQAVPIILLITFLIGCIIAQQGFFHFRKFGADEYVVDLVGILVLREIGVLIVAIMVAGRSGSSYTAEIGSMKMREEIDALKTMGLDPIETLVLPRVIALVIALPILTFLGSVAALYGGELTAQFYAGMRPEVFLARLKDAISITHFKVGMIKAPFMAVVIGVVACTAGLNVKGSAESLGLQTTASVVKSIFLVIVLDGLFAVFFASIGM